MQIKDLDELEKQFNDVSIKLSHIESLSVILLNSICNHGKYRHDDIESLTSVLNEKIINLTEKVASMKAKIEHIK
jgi:hypothetical protein